MNNMTHIKAFNFSFTKADERTIANQLGELCVTPTQVHIRRMASAVGVWRVSGGGAVTCTVN